MNKFFKLQDNGTTVRREIAAGVTTFFTMAYIIFLNPNILSATGMDKGAVMTATIVASVVATLIMGLVANVPYALAPGMGLNAFFTFTVCFAMKIPWWQALGIVFICGLINILITATKVRKMIILAIPESLQYAISGGIGLFIAYIGFMDSKLLNFTPNSAAAADGSYSAVVPSLVNFTSNESILALIGVATIVVLMLLKVKGSILIGIIATTIIGIPLGVTHIDLAGANFLPPDPSPTFGHLDVFGLFSDPSQLFKIIMLIISFSLVDTFDTIGTFLGTGRKTGIFGAKDEEALHKGKGFSSKLDKALFADATATSIGAVFGTSNTTTYVESAAGIEAGGRTGLTSVTTAVLFTACLFLYPIVNIVPMVATAPALIVVGILMMESLGKIKWDSFEDAAGAFFTAVVMPFAYSIASGVAAGFIFHIVVKIFKGKAKEVHPILYIVTGLFLLKYVVDALQIL